MKKFINSILDAPAKAKSIIVFSLDVFISAISFIISTTLRYGEIDIPYLISPPFILSLLIIVAIQAFVFYSSGLYRGIWRYSSTPDLLRLIKGVTLAVIFSSFGLFLFNRLELIPRAAFIIDWLLLIVGLGGSRFTYRVWRDQIFNAFPAGESSKVIIVGAGSGGEQLFREMRSNKKLQMNVVGFVDDDPNKQKKLLHGVPVIGNVKSLPAIIESTDADKIFIAIPSASGEEIRRIVESCKETQIEFKTLPGIRDIISGKTEFSQLRNIEVEDLLGRKEVSLDMNSIGKMLTGKRILVTGAGGSIGSEICRQIAKFGPQKLICFEQCEYFLYELEQELKESYSKLNFDCIIGDVRDQRHVERTFKAFNPDVVIHAAAYKHVPMMEMNPVEAIKTNIVGTRIVAEASSKYKVERFVLISTDKAVNPTNIMGATKRVAEQVCQSVQKQATNTKYMTVRFGNVLGSSGSVIPLFKKQIEKGGPVTVTHPDIRRYFMSIPEACRLVLQAGAIGKGGEIFVLDMGQPIKIYDLAKQMITLAGMRLDIDISIEFSGLRPGEKLFEELLLDNEHTLETIHPLVKIAKAQSTTDSFFDNLAQIENVDESRPLSTIKVQLMRLVPEYKPAMIDQKPDQDITDPNQRSIH